MSPYFLYQAIRYKKYIGSLRQRLGFLPITFNIDGEESIWIHAVSVGEALTARALAADLKARYPRLRLFLSTTTIAGQQVARRSLQHVDAVFYFPFDWTFIVRRTLNLVRPRLFIMMETEIWPNLLRECRARGVKTVMINGRISSRSYPRYRLIRPFFRRVLADVDRFCMQSEESARRLVDLGADPARVTVTGSLKFDSLELPAPTSHGKPRERVLRFFRLSPNRTVVVAGSTMRGEEAAVLRAFARIKATMPERAGDPGAAPARALRRSRAAGARRRVRRPRAAPSCRSTPSRAPTSSCSTRSASSRSSIRWRRRCSSAAASSTTAATTSSSRRCSASRSCSARTCRTSRRSPTRFSANGAAIQVQSERELDEALLALVTDPVRRARLGAAARALVEANRGAKDKTLAVIAELLPSGDVRRTRRRPSLPPGALIQHTERGVRRGGGVAARVVRARPGAAAPARRVRSSASATCASAAAARRRSSPTSRGCCSSAASVRRS